MIAFGLGACVTWGVAHVLTQCVVAAFAAAVVSAGGFGVVVSILHTCVGAVGGSVSGLIIAAAALLVLLVVLV